MIQKKAKLTFSKNSSADKAFSAVVRLLARRDHSVLELKKKLSRYHETQAIEAAIERATERDYIKDPQNLTTAFSRDLNARNKSYRKIKSALAQKGLKPPPYDISIELAKCRQLLVKKYGSTQSLSASERVKVYRYLTNRGFDLETIKKAISSNESDS